MKLLARLDAHGMTDPDNSEGHVTDICNVCGRRIVDHPGHEPWGNGSAKWPHRLYSAVELVDERIDRAIARRWRQR